MALPVNVATCTVTGAFVNADGSIPATGTVTFTPVPAHILDAAATPPTTILGTPIVATVTAGAFDVDLPATDDTDLNPTDWTYHVSVRLPTHAYSFCMDAPEGVVDLATVTPVASDTGDVIVAGPPGADGQGVPAGGDTGEVLTKLSDDDYDTEWTAAPPPGDHATTHAAAGTDPVTLSESQITGLTVALAAKQPLDSDLTAIAALAPGSDAVIQRKVGMWVASTPTEYKTDLDLDKADVGLGNVNNTSDAAKPVSTATQTALNLKADKTTLDGGTTGQILAKVSATDYDTTWIDPASGGDVFDDDDAGIVPASGGGSANFLRADGTWAEPPGVFAGVGNTATFSYNATTSEPPTGNQLRLNSATFSVATRLWVMQTTVDGLDVSIGLARILAGHQIYFQDRDNAANWVKYNVTADGVDDGTYYDFAVAYNSGPGGIPAGQIELQAVAPGTVGVPPAGTTGQVLAKDSSSDYDVSWVDPGVATTRTISTTAPLTGGGDLSANRTLAVSAASDTAAGVVELATAAEVLTGTDTTRAVTAAGAVGAFAPRYQSINAQTGTTYTLVLADDAKLVTLSNASAIALTVPANSTVAYPTGTRVDLAQIGAGQVTVAGAGGVTVNATPGLKFRAQYAAATLIKTATDGWLLVGDLSA